MDLALLLLAVGVIGGAAAVALGRVRGGLEPPTSTLPQVDLPPGPLSPDDVDRVRFSLGLRGYRMDQVDEVLARLRGELAHRDDVIAALRDHNHGPPDHGPPDHAAPDHAAPDHDAPDHAAPDHAAPDHAAPDHAAPDHAAPDHAAPDHAAPDHAAPDQGYGGVREPPPDAGTTVPGHLTKEET